ncbi:5-aminolevulic acid synthase [Tropicimonas sp. TH_r6]|uniref:5-aminolevulic acid synthase n=1 Tax=Tropicimonas sp. TH_r6 TaxID=3082085 RepID=UPI002954DD4D|nr:5-aminolevulic acid synthase [Tropicimonas sp. TH_r6]MDV7142894.1 5-aminolevulic acid synthase [Tropicimonas sp. TH_r6]
MFKREFDFARFAAPILAGALALSASTALAQTVDSKSAKKMLFGKGSTAQVVELDWLDKNLQKVLKQGAAMMPYYGAIAVSPMEPQSSNLVANVSNYHSAQDAQKAALAICNARRTTGEPCVILATVLPKRYKSRQLTLSAEATQAFDKKYRKLKAPKAMAVSPSTGFFGMDRGDGGRALSACNAQAKAKGNADCRIVIADQ